MSFVNYPKYKILINPDSKKTQGLRCGDIVRREYLDNAHLIFSQMVVVDTGVDLLEVNGQWLESPYFTGILLEGDEPKNGELLDFVRITNLYNSNRSGALYLTASDSESPYMDVIESFASEKALCYPSLYAPNFTVPQKNNYECAGTDYFTAQYLECDNDISRILQFTRNNKALSAGNFGLSQRLPVEVDYPNVVGISFFAKGSKNGNNIPVVFGFDETTKENQGLTSISVTTEWQYHVLFFNIDSYLDTDKQFLINLVDYLTTENDSFQIGELNIFLLSDILTFSDGLKTRIGKIKGIVDPVFGNLEGYGAYLQNVYATKNVNIAGTLTAGDENGFSSTFYVGKIHKNVMENSMEAVLSGSDFAELETENPIGIGNVWKFSNEIKIPVQSASWRKQQAGKQFCFSLWLKGNEGEALEFRQDNIFKIGQIELDSSAWKRYHISFFIQDNTETDFSITISGGADTFLTAPQLESGNKPTPYQPTDGILNYTDSYGAWFSKGGIGGTIQNPLLRLNEDGSISSRDRSFVINPDGTGYFASGRFKWTNDTITLQDVLIRWEDFDEQAKENLLPKSVSLSGTDVFHYADELDLSQCNPSEIYVYATEHNFTSVSRYWQYLSSDSVWKDIASQNKEFLVISPTAHYWEERSVLSIKYTAVHNENIYESIFSIYKLYDGRDAYSIYIDSTNGNIFKNGIISTILKASVFKGGTDVTDKIPANNFRWKRISLNAESDELWNSAEHRGKELIVTEEDVFYKAVFDCEVTIS